VTNILISSGLEDEIVVGSTSFTVTTLDSQEVEVTWTPNEEGDMSGNEVTWTPNEEGDMSGNLLIMNNDTSPYPEFLPITEAGNVSLKIYDIRGQEVATLTNGWLAQGSYNVTYDASDLSSGVYIYRLVANEFKASGKMVLLK